MVEDCHRPGNWGNKKLVKNNQDNKIQSVTLCNAQLALGHSPRSWGIFKNFCVKNNLTVCKVTFNCELQKKMGKQDVLVAAPIILLGEQRCSPCSPGSRDYEDCSRSSLRKWKSLYEHFPSTLA